MLYDISLHLVPRQRRSFIKKVGIASIAALAGCSSDGEDGSSGDGSSGDGATTTQKDESLPDPADVGEEQYAEEWRKVASEKATEELNGEKLAIYTTSRSDQWREAVVQRDFEEPYTALKGKISPVTGATDAQQQKYIRQEQAEGTMDIDVVSFNILSVASETKFMDLTSIPGYRQVPDKVKLKDWRGANQVYSYGINYNPDRADDPPETWEDLLDERFSDGEILVDFTPPAVIAGAVMQTLGEDYIRKIEKQNPKQIKSGWGVTKQLGQGAGKVSFADQNHHALRAQRNGLSAEYVSTPDVPFWLSKPLTAAVRPKHPWASKLYIDFMMRPEHGDIQALRPGTVSLDGKTTNPEDYDLGNAFQKGGKVWSTDDFDMTPNELSKRWQELLNSPVA